MVQEVTTNSWFKRIISSFVGVLIGIALVIGGAVLVFWNEGNGLGRAPPLSILIIISAWCILAALPRLRMS